MRIGLIGTNWGRVHCGTFAKHGYKIDTIMGQQEEKTKRVAKEEGIANYTTDVKDLSDMDLVVIASPMETHLEYIKTFKDKWVLCEKPFSGAIVEEGAIDGLRDKNIFFNYSFPQLKTSKEIKRIIDGGEVAKVYKIIANIGVFFPGQQSDVRWFLDVASHKLYFFNYLFGAFNLKDYYIHPGKLDVSTHLSNGDQSLNINLYQAHRESIRVDFKIIGEKGEIDLSGGYLPGENWNFGPVKVNGESSNDGEYSTEEDIWFKANVENVGIFLDLVNSKITREQALEEGLADISRAVQIEKGLRKLIEGN